MSKTLIVGIGNPYRGDDGAGWAVIDGLEGKVSPSFKLIKIRGDIAELIDLLTDHESVYLVDANSGSFPVGSWQRIDLNCQSLKGDSQQTSTHGFGVFQAIELAKNLGKLPVQLILYVINGDRYSMSEGLSPAVVTGVQAVIIDILNRGKSCTNTV